MLIGFDIYYFIMGFEGIFGVIIEVIIKIRLVFEY